MKGSIPLTVGSRAPGASLPNPQIALDQGDSHRLCHMRVSTAAHHSRHCVQPRTLGFWGLAPLIVRLPFASGQASWQEGSDAGLILLPTPRSLTTGRAGATAQGGPPSEGLPLPTHLGLQISGGLS